MLINTLGADGPGAIRPAQRIQQCVRITTVPFLRPRIALRLGAQDAHVLGSLGLISRRSVTLSILTCAPTQL